MSYIKKIIGTLNFNFTILFLSIVVLINFYYCKNEQSEDNSLQKIVEDNFINIVDTLAYKNGSFRALPPNFDKIKINTTKSSELEVFLNKNVTHDMLIENEINNFFKTSRLNSKFYKLSKNEYYKDFVFHKFKNKIGKYKILLDPTYISKYKLAGTIVIKNFKIDKLNNIGFFVVELSSGIKSGIGYIIVIEKINNKWIMIQRSPIYVS